MTALRDTAAAKINLTLRVLGRRADGYHRLESLVAFAAVGDALELVPGDDLSLTAEGPFASALSGENLILRAAEMLRRAHPGIRTGAFRLDKRLPVAAGLGGGSADAAAALRLLLRANPHVAPADIAALFPSLGADVAVCFLSRAAFMWGIGAAVRPLDALPAVPAVLANPGVALATAQVFAALTAPAMAHDRSEQALAIPGPFAARADLIAYLHGQGNDLEPAALALAPAIADTLAALRSAPGCGLARLSGSGATCFGLFDSEGQAAAAARAIAAVHSGWWVVATEVR